MGSDSCDTYCAALVFSSPSGIYGIVKFGEKMNCQNHLFFPFFVYIYTVAVVIFCCGGNISSCIAMGLPVQAVYVLYIFSHTGSRVSNSISFTVKLPCCVELVKLLLVGE